MVEIRIDGEKVQEFVESSADADVLMRIHEDLRVQLIKEVQTCTREETRDSVFLEKLSLANLEEQMGFKVMIIRVESVTFPKELTDVTWKADVEQQKRDVEARNQRAAQEIEMEKKRALNEREELEILHKAKMAKIQSDSENDRIRSEADAEAYAADQKASMESQRIRKLLESGLSSEQVGILLKSEIALEASKNMPNVQVLDATVSPLKTLMDWTK